MEHLKKYVAMKILTTGLNPLKDHVVYLEYGLFFGASKFFMSHYYLKNNLKNEEIAFLEDFYPEIDLDDINESELTLTNFYEAFNGMPIVTTNALLTKKFFVASVPPFENVPFIDVLDVESEVLKNEQMRSFYFNKINEIKKSTYELSDTIFDRSVIIKERYELLYSLLDMDEKIPDLKDKCVSLTGRLSKMKRVVAANYIRSKGGIFFHNVTKETDILVVANNKSEESTNKKLAFLNYQKEDPRKRIVDEETFYKIIGV